MRKVIFLASFLIVILISREARGQGFYTSGTKLMDAFGNEFIIKGINVPLAWFVSDVNNNIANIRNKTGSNCLRIVVTTSTPDNAWQTCVQNCINNNMIPMVELHDVTGSSDANALNNMAQFWASKASFLTRSDIARYILINIANEWGDWYIANSQQYKWRDAYKTAITTIRNAGINTTLVIDAPQWGQDLRNCETIRNYGWDLINHDPKKNILFSVHMYCEWAPGGSSNVSQGLQAVKNAGLPIIVGEFGWQHDNGQGGVCDIPEGTIISTCQSLGIGWLAWSWKGNGGGVEYLDLSNDWAGYNLTSWGNTVVNGQYGTKTAITASVFNGGTPPPPSNNLINNPGWENGSNGWSIESPFVVTTEDKRSGTRSLKLPGSGSWRNTYQTINVEKNTTYIFEAFMKGSAKVNFVVFTPSWSNIKNSIFTPNSSWTKYSFEFNSGNNTSVIIDFQDAGNGTSYIDDVSVYKKDGSGGATTIKIRALGSCGSESMALQINNQTVQTWTVGTSFNDYSYSNYTGGNIRVAFTNDGNVNGCDRNIRIDYILVGSTTYQAENMATNTGVWNSSQNKCGGLKSEWLHCNGYIEFGTLKSAYIISDLPIITKNNRFTITPNPSNGQFKIVFENDNTTFNEIIILNFQGQIVYHQKAYSSIENISLNLNKGIYLVKVKDEIEKIIIY